MATARPSMTTPDAEIRAAPRRASATDMSGSTTTLCTSEGPKRPRISISHRMGCAAGGPRRVRHRVVLWRAARIGAGSGAGVPPVGMLPVGVLASGSEVTTRPGVSAAASVGRPYSAMKCSTSRRDPDTARASSGQATSRVLG
jgi:hypothetical protein